MRARLDSTILVVLFLGIMAGCAEDSVPASSDGASPVEIAPKIVESEGGAEDVQPAEVDEPDEPPDPDNPRHALLIACSKYDHLPASAQLRGPVNDVGLMKNLLTGRFKFPAGNITVLSERKGREDSRPLRANIEREFQRLAELAQVGSHVVVYFSGHGAQQPNDNPDDPADPEPDGLDEILCPADIKPEFDLEEFRVPNSVSDDELRRWLHAVRGRGASVWAIIDACHSGTAIRGTEVYRQLPPDMLVPRDLLQKAARNAHASRGLLTDSSPFELDDKLGGIVAIYAAQPHEPTIELPLPVDSDDARWCGLLTYNLVKILTESTAPITYTELVQRIHREYVASMGRLGPVPLVEGSDQNREVLGTTEWPERSHLALQAEKGGRLKINAGSLHGMTPGTILSVYPPAGKQSAEQTLGYVRIRRAGMTDAEAEPYAFNELEAPRNLPDGARCQIVRRDYGDLRLRVAIDAPAEKESSHVDSWRQQLATRASQEGAVFELVHDLARAQWLVRPVEGNRIVLLPAEGWTRAPGIETAPVFGPAAVDDKLGDWLTEQLNRIARATSLLKISGEMTGERKRGLFSTLFGKESTDLRVELLDLNSAEDKEGKPLEWTRGGLRLEEGAIVALRLRNASPHAVDFTVLFVDSGYGIEPVYPSPKTVVDNRLAPGDSFTVGPLAIDANSVGLEHLIVIALKAEGQPVDFTWLAQKSLEQARAVGLTRGGFANDDNPLGPLFQKALFGTGQTRGLKTANTSSVAVQAVSWQSTPHASKP